MEVPFNQEIVERRKRGDKGRRSEEEEKRTSSPLDLLD
jgi:hypothetical protein